MQITQITQGLVHAQVDVPSDTAGITLRLFNRRAEGASAFVAERVVLLMHGATFSSQSLFDVPVQGVGTSFMDALARAGFDVWAVDARGFGGSTRPSEMSRPADHSAPLTQARVAVRDLAAAVDFIRQHRGVDRLNLLGMSWGATVAGSFAASRGEHVHKLVLMVPLWLAATKRRIDPGGTLGGWRLVDVAAYEAGWRVAAPEAARAALIPDGWFETWAEVTRATDPAPPAPGTIRAPSGPVQDVREHWTANNPLYDPAAIRAPTLVVAAEWDIDVTMEMARDLFVSLTNARRKAMVVVGGATHMLLMERQRRQGFDAVIAFLSGEEANA